MHHSYLLLTTATALPRSRVEERRKRSEEERADAEAAAAGFTIIKYGKVEKPKKLRNLDNQSKIDLMLSGLKPADDTATALGQLLKDAAEATKQAGVGYANQHVESPQSKNQRRVKAITENISLFEAEKNRALARDPVASTADIDAAINQLKAQRRTILTADE